MPSGSFTANASTEWMKINGNSGVRVSLKGTFGGGTVTVEQLLDTVEGDFLDSDGISIQYTANADDLIQLRKGEIMRLTLAGATTPSLQWSVNGEVSKAL